MNNHPPSIQRPAIAWRDKFRTEPKLIVTASVLPPSFSLTKSRELPVIINLTLILIDSTKPITVNINDSFLAPDKANSVNSPYSLTHKDTGKQPFEIYTNIGLATTKITINPDTDMLTIYPGKPFTTQVCIGLDIFFTGETGAGTSADPCLCATPLSCLKVGETYEVGLSSETSGRPEFMWWAPGDCESTVKERVSWWNRLLGNNSFVDEMMFILDPMVKVEWAKRAEIKIEE
ncbi:hypothetical protein ACHAQE_001915 [Botrytis cinerea]